MKLNPINCIRLLGILLFACAGVLLFTNPVAENNLSDGFITPIVAFEFIQLFSSVY